MAVKITQKAYDGIMAVRASGRVNMLDRKGVQRVANDLEEYAAVVWIEDHKSEYAHLIFEGAEIVPDEE